MQISRGKSMALGENSLWCVEDGVPSRFLRSTWEAKVDRSGETSEDSGRKELHDQIKVLTHSLWLAC